MLALLAEVSDSDVSTLLLVLALLALGAAIWAALRHSIEAAVVLLVIAVVIFLVAD